MRSTGQPRWVVPSGGTSYMVSLLLQRGSDPNKAAGPLGDTAGLGEKEGPHGDRSRSSTWRARHKWRGRNFRRRVRYAQPVEPYAIVTEHPGGKLVTDSRSDDHVPDVSTTVDWYNSIGFKIIRTKTKRMAGGEINWAKLSFGNIVTKCSTPAGDPHGPPSRSRLVHNFRGQSTTCTDASRIEFKSWKTFTMLSTACESLSFRDINGFGLRSDNPCKRSGSVSQVLMNALGSRDGHLDRQRSTAQPTWRTWDQIANALI